MKLPQKEVSLRSRVLLLISLSFIIPLVLGAFALHYYLSDKLLAENFESSALALQQITDQIHQDISVNMSDRIAFLSRSSAIQGLESGDLRTYTDPSSPGPPTEGELRVSKMFDNMKQTQDSIHFVFLGLDDGTYIEYPAFQPSTAYDPRTRPWYRDTLKAGDVFITEPYRTSVTSDLVVSVTMPVTLESGQEGVLGITVSLEQLATDLGHLTLPNDGHLIVLSQEEKILINPFNDQWTLHRLDMIGLKIPIDQEETVSAFGQFTSDVKYYYHSMVEPASQWKIIAIYPANSVLSSLNTIEFTIFAVFAFIWATVFLLSTIVTNQVVEPLRTLAGLLEQADHQGYTYDGRLDASAQRKDEIGMITRAVLDMLQTLHHIIDPSNVVQRHESAISKLSEQALVTNRDETAQKESAMAGYLESRKSLADSEDRLQRAFELTNDGFWDYYPRDEVLYLNPKLSRSLDEGYMTTTDSLHYLYQLILEGYRQDFMSRIDQMIAGEIDHLDMEIMAMSTKGHARWFHCKARVIATGDQGLPLRMIGTLTDIHDIRKTSEELAQLNFTLEDRIQERTQDLLAMNEELQATLDELQLTQQELIRSEKMASLGALVTGVAHEVNTPLGNGVTTSSYIGQLTKDFKTKYEAGALTKTHFESTIGKIEEASQILHHNLEKASWLINSFKRVSADQSSEVQRTFRVVEYTKEIIMSLQPELKRIDADVQVSGDETLRVNSFPGAYSQILTNLILNSKIHGYTGERLHIHIAVEQRVNGLQIIYTDDGHGMDDYVCKHIFDPFYTTTRGSGGTGLGMYLVYNLVTHKFNGAIHCESTKNKEAKFTVFLACDVEEGIA